MLRYDFGAKGRPFKSYNAEKGYTESISNKQPHTWERHIYNVGGEVNSKTDLALRATRGKRPGGANINQVPIASGWKGLSAANAVTKQALKSRHSGTNWKKERNTILKNVGISTPTFGSAGNYEAVERTGVEGRGLNQKVLVPDMPAYAWPGGTGTYPLWTGDPNAPATIRGNPGLVKNHTWSQSTFVVRPSLNAPGGWTVYTSYPGS